ncbi:hypothetical protein Taro_014787 [Colocasia esculenta]|uniref:Retrotransposon gag domain-containing protein n=1 Tax=Colocasia esculenta TaxID=4460 RepID=A0A843UK82_COLES|nr:hypothetical protein [Colocasia esculenta]
MCPPTAPPSSLTCSALSSTVETLSIAYCSTLVPYLLSTVFDCGDPFYCIRCDVVSRSLFFGTSTGSSYLVLSITGQSSSPCWVLASSACPRCRESGRSRGNARRSLHSVFFAKVVDAYRGYLSSWVPQVLCEPGCSSGLCPGEFPTEPVTSEAHPYSAQCGVSLARLWPVRGRRTRVKHVTGLTGLDEAFRHSWYQRKAVVMAVRRDWGGGGDDPEESTQRMIERIWESLTDIRTRMDQQAPIPPVTREEVPVAPVPPQPGVEVPFVAPVPPLAPVIAAEEPVVQIERFLRLQPPTYTRGPNPDAAEHWIHEIERVFMTMRCPAADRVVLATFQLRGFAQEWWRLKMQTTFAGRIEGAITWSKFLEVFNDTFFPLQVQQAKREQFRTLQQGESSVLEYQMRFMALSRTVEEVAQKAATLERAVRTRQVGESGSGSFRLSQQSAGVSKGKASAGPSSSGFGKWGQKLKQTFKGNGRGWGGRQQVQQGHGKLEVEESQQSTVRQPTIPPGYRGVQQPQQSQQPSTACPRCRESGRSRGNARRLLHSVFFAKVVDVYRGYLSSWVPQVLLTSEAHPDSPHVRARRRFLYRHPLRSRVVAVLAQRLQQCSFSFFGLQQAKREQFRTLQQGETSVLEYQMRFMALSRHLKVKEEDGEVVSKFSGVVLGFGIFGVSSLPGVREKQGKRQEIVVDAYRGYLSSWVPQVLCEPGCSSGLCPVTSEAHPYSAQVRARRRFLYRRPVRSHVVAVLAQRLQ